MTRRGSPEVCRAENSAKSILVTEIYEGFVRVDRDYVVKRVDKYRSKCRVGITDAAEYSRHLANEAEKVLTLTATAGRHTNVDRSIKHRATSTNMTKSRAITIRMTESCVNASCEVRNGAIKRQMAKQRLLQHVMVRQRLLQHAMQLAGLCCCTNQDYGIDRSSKQYGSEDGRGTKLCFRAKGHAQVFSLTQWRARMQSVAKCCTKLQCGTRWNADMQCMFECYAEVRYAIFCNLAERFAEVCYRCVVERHAEKCSARICDERKFDTKVCCVERCGANVCCKENCSAEACCVEQGNAKFVIYDRTKLARSFKGGKKAKSKGARPRAVRRWDARATPP